MLIQWWPILNNTGRSKFISLGRIFITGIGVISAIGKTVAENHAALKNGICGISNSSSLQSRYAHMLPFGEVKIHSKDLHHILNIKQPGVTRTSLLALHAFDEAVNDAGLSAKEIGSVDTALIGATTVGGMCLTDDLYEDAHKANNGSEYLESYDCASVNIFLQSQYSMRGVINTINTACSSSANAIMYGCRLLKSGYAKRAIVGGADSLAKFTINGFNALHILSAEYCAPFDENRKGLNLGEGAAFLVLEKEEDITNKKVYAEVSGYCNSNDAFHPSSLSEHADGPFLAMQGAMQSAGIDAREVNYINAHGTGTENNDEVESKAILRLFQKIPAFASSKSNIGHTLGAAGAIEAVYAALNLQQQEIYPSLNFKDPIPETKLIPVQSFEKSTLKHVMSNSFGFGGNCTSLIFSQA